MKKKVRKKSLVGYILARKEPFLRFERPWWVLINPEKVKIVEIPPIANKPFNSKNYKIKDFHKVRITIEQLPTKGKRK